MRRLGKVKSVLPIFFLGGFLNGRGQWLPLHLVPSFTAFDWLPISLLGDGQRIDGRFDGRAAVASSAPNGNSVKNPVNQTAERQLGDDWNREVVGAIDCEGNRVID